MRLETFLVFTLAFLVVQPTTEGLGCHQTNETIFCENATHSEITNILKNPDGPYTALKISSSDVRQLDANFIPSKYAKLILSLDLSHNNMQILDSKALKYFTKLVEVCFSNNKLKKIQGKTFRDKADLKLINLSNNGITTIVKGAFDRLPSLTDINLDNNNLGRLKKFSFRNLPELKTLSFINSGVTVIEKKTFDNLPSLMHLNLSQNKFKRVSRGPFDNLDRLQTLDFSGNSISKINPKTFLRLMTLETLYLSENKLGKLKNDAFLGLISLHELHLNRNQFKSINLDALKTVPNVKKLDLSDNKLTYLDTKYLVKVLPNLESVNIQNNNWKCEDLVEMVADFKNSGLKFDSGKENYDVVNVNGIPCNNGKKCGFPKPPIWKPWRPWRPWNPWNPWFPFPLATELNSTENQTVLINSEDLEPNDDDLFDEIENNVEENDEDDYLQDDDETENEMDAPTEETDDYILSTETDNTRIQSTGQSDDKFSMPTVGRLKYNAFNR